MAEPAKITPIGDQTGQTQTEKPQDNGKTQLPGESALWYRRYCLYRDLGHKRSLRAAVAREQEIARLVKEPESATKSPPEKKAGVNVSVSGQKRSKTASTPAPAPAPVVVNVPGSWKNACKVFRWQERAKAYDLHILDTATRSVYALMGDTYANKYKRVQLLELLIKAAVEQLNHASENHATHKTYLAYIKQIASLSAQMEREMSQVTETDMKVAISSYAFCMRDDIEKQYGIGTKTEPTKKK